MRLGDKFDENASALFLNRLAMARGGTTEQQAELLNSFRGYLRAVAVKTVGEEANGKLSCSYLLSGSTAEGSPYHRNAAKKRAFNG